MKIRKLSSRILAYTLTLALLLSSFGFGAITSYANSEVDVWDGSTAERFADGDGSEATPYLIENAEQLRLLVTGYCSADYEASYFKLTKDIYLNDVADGTQVKSLANKKNWAEGLTAGSKANSFYGTLDGDGHTVYGLYAYGEVAVLGLLPGINSATVIKNLNFDNLYINGAGSTGAAIAGAAFYYTWQKTAQISYCSVKNAVIGQSGNMEFAAGLVADTHEVKVNFTNCYVSGSTFSDWSGGAGFVANDWDDGATTYTGCYSAGAYPVSAAVNKATINNVYTNTAAPEGTVATGIVTLEDAQMKGNAAKNNMAGFDFELTWKTVENGYPVFSVIEFWDGTTAETYAGGTGTASDPYLIENGAQLLKMVKESTASGKDAASVTNNYFKITKDIYLNPVTAEDMVSPSVDSWAAKGYRNWDGGYRWAQNTGFCGNIDGDGHTIYGLYVESGCYSGFLANVIGHATVNNLHFKNAFVRGASSGCSPAVIIGAVNGNSTVRSTATVTNCTVDNGYVFSDHTGSWRNGIIVGGGFNEGQIFVSNCAVTNSRGVITNTSTEKRTAAFIGNTNYTKTHLIQNCFTDSSMHPVTDATTEANYDVIHDNKVYKNIYTSAAQPSYDTNGDVTYLTEEQMKGENAKIYMPTLSFKYIWQTVENGYPEINLRGDLWNGDKSLTDHSSFKGSGTADDPYLIENGAQLYYAAIGNANLTDGSCYKLVNDIILNDTSVEGWEASANTWGMNDKKRFNGTLDGDGHTIEGLYINVASTAGRYGLFSYVGQDTSVSTKVAEFKNFTIVGASVTNTTASSFEGVGIVAGQASGETVFENIYIDDTSKVYAPNVKGVAGIVARSNQKVTINNCAVHGTYTGGSHVSSFLGTFWGGSQTITNSYSAAHVPVTTSRTPTITNVYATVKTEENHYDNAVVLLTADQMKGEAAKDNMSGLDFDFLWKTTNGYPVLRDMDERLAAWDGSAATTLEGEGTKVNPYKISNGAELYYAISTYSNEDVTVTPETQKYFVITNDINLGNKQWFTISIKNWLSNSNYNNLGFNGIIYGNGHTVYNLYSNVAAGAVGLIPIATQGAEIYDLHLEKGNLPRANHETYAVGALVGMAKGIERSQPIIIDGCSVKDFTLEGQNGTGGIIGYAYSQSYNIKDCYVSDLTLAVRETNTAKAGASAFVGFVDGSEVGNSFAVENSYCTNENPLTGVISAKVALTAATTYKNVYTSCDVYNGSTDGITKLIADKMTGAAAKTNLNGFNFNQKWAIAEGAYPVHTDMDYRAKYWNGTVASAFAGGSGTEAEPYLISNASELYLLANLDREATHGKFFKLTKNIAISNVYDGWANDDAYNWASQKAYLDGFTYSASFAGTLDGAGYTVSGIFYNDAISDGGTYAYGLIPFVTSDAVIKNLKVADVAATVSGNAYVGAVAGAAHVTSEDAENPFKMVQFIAVDAARCNIIAANAGDILGGATRGVKFELCNAAKHIGSGSEKVYTLNCNAGKPFNKDMIIYNSLNADSEALALIRKLVLGKVNVSVADINGVGTIDILDLVSAAKNIGADDDEEVLVWSQEFSGNAMDYSVWSKNTTMSKGTTLNYADNYAFDGNSLKMYNTYTGDTDANGNKIYNVAYGISTRDTMSFKYGRLEMRAKIPFGAGAFPSLWLTSRNAIGNGTVNEFDTEIDIFEVFGKTASVDKLVTCIHKWYNDEEGARTGDECSCGSGILAGNGYKVDEADRDYQISGAAQDEFHTIVFDWTEDTMTFSVDGNVYYTAKRSEMNNFDISGYDTNSDAIFNQYMYLRLNNHMYTAGDGAAYKYDGNADEIDASALDYEIDYIRLYQKANGEINLK